MGPGPPIRLILGGSRVFSPPIHEVGGQWWENKLPQKGVWIWKSLHRPSPHGISWSHVAASGWSWVSPFQQCIPSLPTLCNSVAAAMGESVQSHLAPERRQQAHGGEHMAEPGGSGEHRAGDTAGLAGQARLSACGK